MASKPTYTQRGLPFEKREKNGLLYNTYCSPLSLPEGVHLANKPVYMGSFKYQASSDTWQYEFDPQGSERVAGTAQFLKDLYLRKALQ